MIEVNRSMFFHKIEDLSIVKVATLSAITSVNVVRNSINTTKTSIYIIFSRTIAIILTRGIRSSALSLLDKRVPLEIETLLDGRAPTIRRRNHRKHKFQKNNSKKMFRIHFVTH